MKLLALSCLVSLSVAAQTLPPEAEKVVAAYEKKEGPKPVSFAIHKGKRVYRAGTVDAVLARMLERAREAYAACNERCKGDKRCWDCCGRPA